jgi:YgiT-type zinc finger domain-containing protein
MKCTICKEGDTHLGSTTVTLERSTSTLVFKQVPAQVCENCGEAYIEEAISKQLLEAAERAVKSGVQVEVRTFAQAS